MKLNKFFLTIVIPTCIRQNGFKKKLLNFDDVIFADLND